MPRRPSEPSAFTVSLSATGGGITDTWIGNSDSNWFNPANWSGGVVPGSADTAVIKGGGNFATTLSGSSTTVGNLQISGGYLIITGAGVSLPTDIGNYSQDSGFVAFGADANQLQIGGTVNRDGGVFLVPRAQWCSTARPPRPSPTRRATRSAGT